jgi:DNA-binding SARP family transcriptional activator
MAKMNPNEFADTFPTDAPFVIFHPNFSDQHVLLSKALAEPGRTPVILSLQTPNSDLSTAYSLFSTALAEQFEQKAAGIDADTPPEKAAQAALKALKSLEPYVLVVDSFDLASEPVEAWVGAIVKGLPSGSQVLLGGRQLPFSLVSNGAVKGKVHIYPVDPDRMLLDYVSQPKERGLLEVYGLGTGQALINGQRIDKWDGMLPRSLFFYFIDRGMVTRDEIFQTFWPSLSVREATNVFHVTKRKISEILQFDLTVYWSGFYRISPDIDLHYDVVKFVEHVQNSSVAEDSEAARLLQQAIDIYEGRFLSSLDMPWAVSRRNELNLTYVEALSNLARLRQNQNRNEEALGLFLRAAATQPQREDLARGIMALFTELGQPQKALEVFNRLSIELKRTLGVSPDRRTIELAEQIQAHA